MLVRCIHCDTDLVAPARSEYWGDNRARHIWHCPKCCGCFSSVVSFPADTNIEPLKEILTQDSSLFPSLLVA
jgi:hypothetical protein